MGVPKFYRWISERYPCLSEVVKEYQLPEFDNLYLDMNGIIHTSSHPEDDNPHFRITEEKIFELIFHYIEVLFRMIKPKKVFFMAIDGVAPRAKMNQQRGRRFRSAREAEDLVKKALDKGESLPTEARFDSNCITPGTEFMVRLHEQLKFFVARKVSTDRLWQGVRIYLSGHETPGEGEHKIMDFIRSEKAQNAYDSNTRHCLYGLDADLIMLGLTTHEPHFSLLREEVRFGGKNAQKRSTAAEETTFHLLHLSLMREYLGYEFRELETKLPFEYSVENVIDDWVMMGFLVGNDFIPHLPHLHIHQDCLPLLWAVYKRVLPKLDGYLNEGGLLNLPRFEKYLSAVSQIDMDQFAEQYSDMKWVEGKMKKLEAFQDFRNGNAAEDGATASGGGATIKLGMTNSLSSERTGIPTAEEFVKTRKHGEEDEDFGEEIFEGKIEPESSSSEEEEQDGDEIDDAYKSEFAKFKANYYMEKMNFKKVTPVVLEEQAMGYVRAIQWILHYYYNGCPSWSWYYPHHYAPYLSDIKKFKDIKIEYDPGQPFLPFQQLMAVLPTASKALLPKPLQSLMVNESSPVIDYYPVDFMTDLNGKQQEWEAVVLIPFIEERRLLEAMAPLIDSLSPSEKERNRHGPHLLYTYTPESLGALHSSQPDKYPPITNNHAALMEIPKDGFVLQMNQLRKGLCEGVLQDLYFCGFPTLKHIQHSVELCKAGVKVFQMSSRNDNMMLSVVPQPLPVFTTVSFVSITPHLFPSIDNKFDLGHLVEDGEAVAGELLGKSVFIGWPHLQEALVVAVASEQLRFSAVEERGRTEVTPGSQVSICSEPLSRDAQNIWAKDVDHASEWYRNRMGIVVGGTHLLIYAKPLSGRKYVCGQRGLVTLEKQWHTRPEPYLHQIIIKDIAVYDQSFTQFKTLADLFKPGTKVFLLGNPHYGSMGEVVDVEIKDDPRVRANFVVVSEPSLGHLTTQQARSSHYMAAYSVAQRLGITPHLLSRVTGTIYLLIGSRADERPARVNIGLNLKFNKTNQEVPGYSRKQDNEWLYSSKVGDIMAEYLSLFPELFEKIQDSKMNDNYYSTEIFPNDAETVTRLTTYVNGLACKSVATANHGSSLLDDFIIADIEKEVDKVRDQPRKKPVKMHIRPHLLYQPLSTQTFLSPDPSSTFELFDRVINVRDGYSVPLGLRGTITGISSADKVQDVVYEVVFDEAFPGGLTLRCSPERAYRMPASALISLTYGERKDRAGVNTSASKHQSAHSSNHNSATASNRNSVSVHGGSGRGRREVGSQYQPVWGAQQPKSVAMTVVSRPTGSMTVVSRPTGSMTVVSRQATPMTVLSRHTVPASVVSKEQQPQPFTATQKSQASIQESIQATVQVPVQAPVQALVQAPVQALVQGPVQGPGQAPVQVRAGSAEFAQIWGELRGVPIAHVSSPAAPHTHDLRPPQAWLQVDLRPPQAWLQQSSAAAAASSAAPAAAAASSTAPAAVHSSAVGGGAGAREGEKEGTAWGASDELARLFGGLKLVQGEGGKVKPAEAKPGPVTDRQAYGRQVTLDELFKGAETGRQQVQHEQDKPASVEYRVDAKTLTDQPHSAREGHGRKKNREQGRQDSDKPSSAKGKGSDKKPTVFYNSSLRGSTTQDVKMAAEPEKIPEHTDASQPQQNSNNHNGSDDDQQQQAEAAQNWQQQLLRQQEKLVKQQQEQLRQQQQRQQLVLKHNQQAQQQLVQQQMMLNQQRQQQQQQMYIQHNQRMQPHRSSVVNLALWCQSRGLAPPAYMYQTFSGGKHQARVSLSNGGVYVGSLARNQEQAAQSAADVSLYNLQASVAAQGGPQMRQGLVARDSAAALRAFTASPNSAFTPVTSLQGKPPALMNLPQPLFQPVLRPFMPPLPPPAMAQVYPPTTLRMRPHQGGHGGAGGGHGGGGQGQLGREGSMPADGDSANTRNSQFIPTQVLRHQKTPAKKSDASVTASTKANDSNHQSLATGLVDVGSAAGSQLDAVDQVLSVVNPAPVGALSTTKSKKKPRSSRLAANFGITDAAAI